MLVVFAPHPDDAEWGCGGLISAHAPDDGAEIVLLSTSAEIEDVRVEEAYAGATALGARLWVDALGVDGRLLPSPEAISAVETHLEGATLVLVPPLTDTHQDHRAVHQIVLAAARRRPVSIWEYETPSAYDWSPDVWVPLFASDVSRKALALSQHASQNHNRYMKSRVTIARARAAGWHVDTPMAEHFRVVRQHHSPRGNR